MRKRFRVASVVLTAVLGSAGCGGSKPAAPEAATPGHEDAKAPRSREGEPMGAPPEGGGGFLLGMTPGDAEAACAEKRGKWGPAGDGNSCEMEPGRGLSAVQLLDFCGDTLCWIHSVIVLNSDSDQDWIGAFGYLGEELEARYGGASRVILEVPDACKGHLVECLARGEARGLAIWKWQTGHAVLLRMAGNEDAPPTVSVSFANPEGVALMERRAGMLQ